MIHYRKHIIKYDAGFWCAERKGKESVDYKTLPEAKKFIDYQCNLGLSNKKRERGIKQ